MNMNITSEDRSVEFVATCLFGLEKFVGEEIDALGYKRVSTIDGRVTFIGDISAIARANIWLRCAERVYIKLGSFRASTFDELFEGTRALPLERWIGKEDAFPIKGHSVRSALTSIPDCQSIIKKASATRLGKHYGLEILPETGAKCQMEFFILDDTATLMLDTTGDALHKRGYRPEAGVAPLRETLAAAMVKIARPRDDVLLLDPFCGSGTIPVEAALLMTNRAPGAGRSFAAEHFGSVPADIWRKAREEAADLVKTTVFEAYGSDIDPAMVTLAGETVRRAGVGSNVKIFRHDARTIETHGRRGTIVCNPPYGERLGTVDEAHRLYREMGQAFARLDRWQIYIITSDEQFEQWYGRRADKVRRLYNGMIKCGYFQFFRSGQNPRS